MLDKRSKDTLLIIFNDCKLTIAQIEKNYSVFSIPWDLNNTIVMAAILGDVYMSIERVFRLFVENVYHKKIIKDESWHKRLINIANESGLIPEGTESTIQDLRKFRHLIINGYHIKLTEKIIREKIPTAIESYLKLKNHIYRLFPELNFNDNPWDNNRPRL
jgi:uncharacterized protein YutE (UPF0331/DUF86 family)